jgi:hypothetical protein
MSIFSRKARESMGNNDLNERVVNAFETILATAPAGNPVPEQRLQPIPEKRSRFKRWWPRIAVGALAGAVVALSRGCWHRNKSWPTRVEGHSYQVCLTCGAMRLFDEKTFRSYGPFRYDLNTLIAWEKSKHERLHLIASRKRTA